MAATHGIRRETPARPASETRSLSARRTFGELARIAVVSDQRLVRDAIKVALLSWGFSATAYNSPVGTPELWELARLLERVDAAAVILVYDLNDRREVRAAAAVIGEIRLRWLVVTGTPIGPGWGAMLAAGAEGRGRACGSRLEQAAAGTETASASTSRAAVAGLTRTFERRCGRPFGR